MKFLLAVASFALAVTSISVPPNEKPKGLQPFCGTKEPPKEVGEVIKFLQSQKGKIPVKTSRSPLSVDVYFHFIHGQFDNVTTDHERASKHIEILNENFEPGNISFQLKDVDWAINPDWARDNSTRDEMFRLFHRGDYTSLNVYSVEKVDCEGHAGWSAFPDMWARHEGRVVDDGVVVRDTMSPDGNYDPTTSKILVHEVGHWFGLLHTFSESCSAEGDMISDTPASVDQSGSCSETLDSCPDEPGLDPVHNHMSYSDRDCCTEFTQGQYDAIAFYWSWLRSPRGRLQDIVSEYVKQTLEELYRVEPEGPSTDHSATAN